MRWDTRRSSLHHMATLQERQNTCASTVPVQNIRFLLHMLVKHCVHTTLCSSHTRTLLHRQCIVNASSTWHTRGLIQGTDLFLYIRRASAWATPCLSAQLQPWLWVSGTALFRRTFTCLTHDCYVQHHLAHHVAFTKWFLPGTRCPLASSGGVEMAQSLAPSRLHHTNFESHEQTQRFNIVCTYEYVGPWPRDKKKKQAMPAGISPTAICVS